MSDTLIKVENVSKKFCLDLKTSLWYGIKDMSGEMLGKNRNHVTLRDKEFWAVKDVSFEVRRGECLGLIGRNGAGKSTLLKMLNGLLKPDTGRIEMRGRVGALIELGAGFNPVLTGRENIYINAAVLGFEKEEIDQKFQQIIDFSEIDEFLDTPVQYYSSGMKVRLGFAVASSLKPDIMLLDEILAVGDMGFQAKCFNRLGELRNQGTSFILVSHNMHQITRFCYNALFMQNGCVSFLGPVINAVALFSKQIVNEFSQKGFDYSGENENAGTMQVTINRAYFTNLQGEIVTNISSLEHVSFIMHYECKKKGINNPVIEIIFRDTTGVALFHISTRISEINIGILQEVGILVIEIPFVPANNQLLNISIVIWDTNMMELIFWKKGYRLEVEGNSLSTGLITLPCEWKHNDSLL